MGNGMMIKIKLAAAVFLACFAGLSALHAQKSTLINFPRDSRQDAKEWLQANGFALKNGADDSGKFQLSFSRRGLIVQALKPALGLLVKKGLNIGNFKKMTLKWGVASYPPGANWDKGVHNEPLMIYVFFGETLYSSDSIFIPDSPPYIGFYLGQNDKVGGCHIGRHFTKGGRYVCMANPPAGQTTTTEIDLAAEFKKAFGDTIPMPTYISGISVECDTSDLSGANLSTAFVESIEITN